MTARLRNREGMGDMGNPDGALNVAPGLALPADAVTQSFALLAVRRAGKSNAAAVIAEEMHAAGLPWVAIDPKGDWWGLRSSGDGRGPGLPVPVFGGLHGDVPLTPEAGKLVAEVITEANLTCILDVSDFPSKAAQMRFLAGFAEHLFRLHRKNPHPRHLFLEEADEFCPQRVMGEQAKCTGAWSKIVKQGGAFGLGATIISQRSAVVNKDVLTQVETLIVLRTTSPQDRAAVKAWTDYHDASREIVDSLPGLEDGEAWVVSPHWLARHGQPAVQRVRFRQRRTFDSGATPTMATVAQRPATLADIDLGAILDRMEAVAGQAANDDPVALRKRVADLERQLAAKGRTPQDAVTADLRRQVADLTAERDEVRSRPPERVEVPVVTPGEIAAFEQQVAAMREAADRLELSINRAAQAAKAVPAPVTALPPRAVPAPPRPLAPKPPKPAAVDPVRPEAPSPEESGGAAPAVSLKAGERNMLAMLARMRPHAVTRAQLGALTGFAASGATFRTYLNVLRRHGLAVLSGDVVEITEAGLAATDAVSGDPLASAEIRAIWNGKLKAGERAMLNVLIGSYPSPVTRAELGVQAGFEATGATFRTYLNVLKRNLLAEEGPDGVRAADVFFLEEETAGA